jgi:20S proteasome alpha/beta subunit
VEVTLVLALAGSNGVVLAGDRRTAIEEEERRLVADTSRKIFQVSDHVSVALCGRGDLGVYLIEKLAREARMRETDGIRSLFEFAPQFLIAAYEEATCRIQSRSKPPVGFIFAGLDRDPRGVYGQPRIYSMYEWEGFQPLISTTGWDSSGIVWIAEYLISRFYAPSMTVGQLTRLASLAISETASQDSRVGGEPLLSVITPSGYRETIGDHFMLSYAGTSEGQSRSLATSVGEARKQNGLLRDRPHLGWRVAAEAVD